MYNASRRPTYKTLALATFVVSSGLASAQDLVFVGTATDMETGELAYIEEHRVDLDESGQYVVSNVTYSGPDGSVYAVKSLDFSQNIVSPELSFEDPRSGQRYLASLTEQRLTLESISPDESETSVLSTVDDKIVVDAGFDRMLLQHWDKLIEGKEKSFQFLALTRGSSIEFTLSTTKVTDAMAQFEIEPSSWFIRLLVDPIVLDYDRSTRRLMRYEGITNIAKMGTDRNYSAVIEYQYYDDPESLAAKDSQDSPSS